MNVNIFGGFRTVWLIVMFDLPTQDKEDRRNYQLFRDFLLKDGFDMMQYSVYIRHCASEDNAIVHRKRIQNNLPQNGEVRVLSITDKQFERIKVYYGKIKREPKSAPEQISLF